MKSGDFYVLDGGTYRGSGYFVARGLDANIPTTTMQNYLAGHKVPSRPVEISLMGSRIGDFLPGEMSLFVTDRIVKIFTDAKITGWKTYALSVINKKSEPVSGFHGLQITGRAGPLTAKSKKGNTIDFKISSWHGSDLFVPEGTWLVIAHPRVIELLEKNKVKGADWRLLADVD